MSDDLGSALGYTKPSASTVESDLGAALGYSAPAPGTDRAARKSQREASRDRIENGGETAFVKPTVAPDPARPDVRSGFVGGAVRGLRNIIDSGAQMLVRGANAVGLVSDAEVRRVEDINRAARQDYEENWKPTASGRVGEFIGTAGPLVAMTGGTSLPAVLGSGAVGGALARPDLREDMTTSEYFSGKAVDAAVGAGTAGALKGLTAAAPAIGRLGARRAANTTDLALSPTAHAASALAHAGYGNLPMAGVQGAAAAVLSRPAVRQLSERLVQRLNNLGTKSTARTDLLGYGAPSVASTIASAGKQAVNGAMPVAGGVAVGSSRERQAVPTVAEAQQGQPSQPSLEDLGASLGYSSSAQPQAEVDLGSALGYSQPTKAAGASSAYTKKVAQIESGGNPNARNPNSSASGTYQFTDGTWRQMVKQYGRDTGITESMKSDPRAQETMMKLFTRDNRGALKQDDIPISDATLYAAHFLGSGGAKKFFNAPADAVAADVLPEAARSNKTVFYHRDGRPKTIQEVYGWMETKTA